MVTDELITLFILKVILLIPILMFILVLLILLVILVGDGGLGTSVIVSGILGISLTPPANPTAICVTVV